uniref:Protein involved in electron ransfer n=1 Tax=uncultured sulfate-reducing bacterium TaxID=153939 RepID=Q3IBM1_9BACT|nr:protein involved in electron ransfer [uncultured sulfate-reducing bacterium]
MSELQLLMYVAYAFLFIGTGYRAYKMANMPVHLRWDLYPIPHEKGKGHYGGSYFEEVDWWTKPAEVSLRSELKEMGKEILFIQSMYHNNRSLWMFSFPFHFGLYLSIVFVLLIFFGAFLGLVGWSVSPEGNALAKAVYYATIPLGIIGPALGALGVFGLLVSRMTRTELQRTSVRTDYFNLVLLLAVFVSGLIVWATQDTSYAHTRAFIASLISFKPAASVSSGFTTHMILAAAFLIYMPFTHMTHFVGKYFTYHKVRWEDERNVRGSELEKRITQALGYELTWSAPHIKTGGTWAEAATEPATEAATEESRKSE